MDFTNEKVRRQDRLLDESSARELLRTGEYGVLSLQREDAPGGYGVPLSYVWDGADHIFIHCAPAGRKLRCIDRCDRVSFVVVGRTNVIPERFTTGYESVMADCTATYDLSDDDRRQAMRLFVAKYCPAHTAMGNDYIEKSFHRTRVLRLTIHTLSAKQKNMF